MFITDTLRQLLRDCPDSGAEIARQTGLAESTISRIKKGGPFGEDSIDLLGWYFGCYLTVQLGAVRPPIPPRLRPKSRKKNQ